MRSRIGLLCILLTIIGPTLSTARNTAVNPPAEVERRLRVLSFSWHGTARPTGYRLELSEDGKHAVAQVDTADRSVQMDLSVLHAAERVLTQYAVMEWDGFHGSDPNVLDGEGFSLCAEFVDGSSICASGENCFPPNYRDVRKALDALMMPALEAAGWK